jgi:DNA (cytosine-5)-methyltransferase 1
MAPTYLANLEKHGIPQKRNRIFFVGNNQNLNYDFPKESKIANIKNIIKFSLEDAIEIDVTKYEYLKDVSKINFVENNGKPQEISGKPHAFLLRKLEDGEISFGVRNSPTHVEIVNLNNPCKTIHCAYRFQPRLFALMKQNNKFYIRTLTVDELKQIQSFPKSFKFKQKKLDSINQIGNAAPPKIVKDIANEIKKQDPYFK